jgi:NAD-dependent dihydropyrimidine dehydrogenase PreA subunit
VCVGAKLFFLFFFFKFKLGLCTGLSTKKKEEKSQEETKMDSDEEDQGFFAFQEELVLAKAQEETNGSRSALYKLRPHATARVSEAKHIADVLDQDPETALVRDRGFPLPFVGSPFDPAATNFLKCLVYDARVDLKATGAGVIDTSFMTGFRSRWACQKSCLPNHTAIAEAVLRPSHVRRNRAGDETVSSALCTGSEAVDGASALALDGIEPFTTPGRPGSLPTYDAAAVRQLEGVVDTLEDKGGLAAFLRKKRGRQNQEASPGLARLGARGLREIVFGALRVDLGSEEAVVPRKRRFVVHGITRQDMALVESCLDYVPVLHVQFVQHFALSGLDPQLIAYALGQLPVYTEEEGGADAWSFPVSSDNPVAEAFGVLSDPSALYDADSQKRLYAQFEIDVTVPADGPGRWVTSRDIVDSDPRACTVRPPRENLSQLLCWLPPGGRLHVLGFVGLTTRHFNPMARVGSLYYADRPSLTVLGGADFLAGADALEPPLVAPRAMLEFAHDHCPENVFLWRRRRRRSGQPGEEIPVVPPGSRSRLAAGREHVVVRSERCTGCGACSDVRAGPDSSFAVTESPLELVPINIHSCPQSSFYSPLGLFEAALAVAKGLLDKLCESDESLMLRDFAARRAWVPKKEGGENGAPAGPSCAHTADQDMEW